MARFEYDVVYDGHRESPDLVPHIQREIEKVHSTLLGEGFSFQQTFSPEYCLSYLIRNQNGSGPLSVLIALKENDSPNSSEPPSKRATLTFFGIEKEIIPFKTEILKRTTRLRLE